MNEKIIAKGFELLKLRDYLDKLELDKFQSEKKLNLPPLYKLFLESFVTGRDIPLRYAEYLNPKFNEKLVFCSLQCLIDKANLQFDYFYSIEEAEEVYNQLYLNNLEFESQSFFPFGADSSGHCILLVGTNHENSDKVFIESDNSVAFLSSNLFEFVRSLVIVADEEIGFGIEYSQLYKKWGEDFWRVKE